MDDTAGKHARRPGGRGSDRGRPRDPGVDAAIISATLALLAERGYSAMTVADVAQRAGVSRPVVYRRWADKAQLVVEALAQFVEPPHVAVGDDPATVMTRYVELLVRTYSETPAQGVLPGLVAAMAEDPTLATRYRELFIEPFRQPVRAALAQSIVNGELAVDTPIELVLDALAGPVYVRTLITGQPLDPSLSRETVDMVMARYRATPSHSQTNPGTSPAPAKDLP